MARLSKESALARLVEIADLHEEAEEAYDERVTLWEFLLKSGVSQAELARISRIKNRGDVMQSIKRRRAG